MSGRIRILWVWGVIMRCVWIRCDEEEEGCSKTMLPRSCRQSLAEVHDFCRHLKSENQDFLTLVPKSTNSLDSDLGLFIFLFEFFYCVCRGAALAANLMRDPPPPSPTPFGTLQFRSSISSWMTNYYTRMFDADGQQNQRESRKAYWKTRTRWFLTQQCRKLRVSLAEIRKHIELQSKSRCRSNSSNLYIFIGPRPPCNNLQNKKYGFGPFTEFLLAIVRSRRIR